MGEACALTDGGGRMAASDPDLLDTTEGLEARRRRHWYDRLMMLADGVFAVAITFLVADIASPAAWDGTWAALWLHLVCRSSTPMP